MWDVLDACFSKGRESFEIIHQNTGCQDNVVTVYAFDAFDLQVWEGTVD